MKKRLLTVLIASILVTTVSLPIQPAYGLGLSNCLHGLSCCCCICKPYCPPVQPKPQGCATIHVYHQTFDGYALKSNTYTVNPGYYGPYLAESFPGYGPGTLAPSSSPPSGTIGAGQVIAIIYNYKAIQNGTVVVLHRDVDTGATLRQDIFYVPAGPYGPYGPIYFPGYGPGVWQPSSDLPQGTIAGLGLKQIVYDYRKEVQVATINVVHINADTWQILKSNTYQVAPGYYGPYNAEYFYGFLPGSIAPYSDPAYGYVSAGQSRNIVYLYRGVAVE
jgi:hypothetical protein